MPRGEECYMPDAPVCGYKARYRMPIQRGNSGAYIQEIANLKAMYKNHMVRANKEISRLNGIVADLRSKSKVTRGAVVNTVAKKKKLVKVGDLRKKKGGAIQKTNNNLSVKEFKLALQFINAIIQEEGGVAPPVHTIAMEAKMIHKHNKKLLATEAKRKAWEHYVMDLIEVNPDLFKQADGYKKSQDKWEGINDTFEIEAEVAKKMAHKYAARGGVSKTILKKEAMQIHENNPKLLQNAQRRALWVELVLELIEKMNNGEGTSRRPLPKAPRAPQAMPSIRAVRTLPAPVIKPKKKITPIKIG